MAKSVLLVEENLLRKGEVIGTITWLVSNGPNVEEELREISNDPGPDRDMVIDRIKVITIEEFRERNARNHSRG